MSREWVEVNKPGLLTTVQDAGRTGYLKDGVVVSGAMDQHAYSVANELVGNKSGAAVIELTLVGPVLRFLADVTIGLCGANLSPHLDGEPIRTWWSHRVKRGQVLSFGQAVDGMRAYLSVQGGIDVPLVLGSRSTYLRGELGGYKGRPLQKGDVLFASDYVNNEKMPIRGLKKELRPNYVSGKPFRVILGPDQHLFTERGMNSFLNGYYEVTNDSDRMGSRLRGEAISHVSGADLISDAVTFGTIQVPGDGQPIVLLADRQTTGGYARIAHIVTEDLPRFVQQKPGTIVRFMSKEVKR